MALAPGVMVFEDKELKLHTYQQLEQLSHKVLRQRAWQTRDQVGADRLPPVPHHSEAMIMWLLETQSALTRIVGPVEYSIFDFGFPKQGLPSNEGIFGRNEPAPAAPVPAQGAPYGMDAPQGHAPPMYDPETISAFNEAARAREAAKVRARGTGIF